MGNIIGQPFDNYVKSQVEVRQKSLGQITNISADDLKYYTTKTPWLRLASSVNLLTNEEVQNQLTNPSLASSSDTVLDRLIKAGVPEDLIKGKNLAKNFILQGGALSMNDDGNIKINKGLNYNNDIFNGAYGWGGVSERGYVPMPGIESAQTTYYNNGALSKATINVKCYSKAQFQLLDALYLRPGYTLLLEFGWSTYLNSTEDSNGDGVPNSSNAETGVSDLEIGALQTYDGFKSKPLQFLLNPDSGDGPGNQFQMLTTIQQERRKHSGNYEAVFGKITNFKWSFGTDGSYNCEISLIGMGNLIESLKLNVTDPNKDNQSNKSDTIKTITKKAYVREWLGGLLSDYLQVSKNDESPYLGKPRSVKNAFFKKFTINGKIVLKLNATKQQVVDYILEETGYDERIKDEQDNIIKNNNNNPLNAYKDDTRLNKIFYDLSQEIQQRWTGEDGGQGLRRNGIKNGIFILSDTFNGETKTYGGQKITKSIFIKLATLLKIIEQNCNLFSNKDDGTPMIKFDFDYSNMENDQNFMAIIPPNISTNPQKCLVAYNKMSIKGFSSYTADIPTGTELNKTLTQIQDFLVDDNPFVGRLGNVYINLRFAADAVATSNKDSDGAISVLSYVKTILQGINESMGNINNFSVMYSEDEGSIKIYDETPKVGLIEEIPEKFTKINIFGVKRNQGSFVTNIGLDAEIPQNFATMISIGAQASGNNLMGNSLSFSNYNKGLIDRIIPEKVDYDTLNKDEETPDPLTQAKTIATQKLYYKSTTDKVSPLESVYVKRGQSDGGNVSGYNFTPEVTNDLTENYTSYIKLIQGELSRENKVPSPFFLPFNLNLELEGISGIKLFSKFRISDDILPPSYEKDSVDIIVKAINHNVDIQKWSTTIDTQSVPRFKPLSIEPPDEVVIEENDQQKQLEEAAKDEPPTDPNEDIITRLRLTRLADNGYQTLSIMEVLDESGNTLYALPTVELSWDDNKNNVSCIPTGTYNVASRVSPKYGDCFIISELNDRNEIINTGKKITGYNETDRGYVLIHEAPAAQGNKKPWLLGCMAPGFKFNTNQSDGRVPANPRGTGPSYGGKQSPSHLESVQANQKLIGTLWNVGKNPMFKLEIKALNGVNKPIESNFYSFSVTNEIKRVENITGEKYTYEGGAGQNAPVGGGNIFAPTL